MIIHSKPYSGRGRGEVIVRIGKPEKPQEEEKKEFLSEEEFKV